MRVAMIAPRRRDCGIGDYSRELADHLRRRVMLRSLSIEEVVGAVRPIDADVVHLQYEHAFFLADDDPAGNVDRFLARLTLPTLITLHCLPLDDPRWRHWLEAPGLAFHVLSGEHAASLRRMAPGARILETLLPVGRRVPTTESPRDFRSRIGVGERPMLAIFGFVKRHKGYDVALAALEQLPPEVVLVIAGGPQDDAGEALVGELVDTARARGVEDRLHVTGYLEPHRVGAVLGAADLVLAPFHTVTASASVATALAWERPVVASGLPQFRELEARFGAPRCTPPGDAGRLAAAVAELLGDEAARRRLSRGATRARTACGYEHVARVCERAYRELLVGARPEVRR